MKPLSTEHEHEDGAARLLAAARSLFAARGYDGVCVRDLIDTAGVSRPTLYYYYGSKEGLFRAAVSQVIAELDEALARAAATAGRVRERVEQMCRVLETSRYEWAFSGNLAHHGAGPVAENAPRPARFAAMPMIIRRLAAVIVEGVRAGDVAPVDPHDAATALIGAAGAVIVLPAEETARSDGRDRLTRVVDVVFAGLAHAGPDVLRPDAAAPAKSPDPPRTRETAPPATRPATRNR